MKMKRVLLLIMVIVLAAVFSGCKAPSPSSSESDSPTATANVTAAALQNVSYEGYLIDKHCFAIKSPEKDTRTCLLMASCEASGYGIAVKQADGSFVFYPFDENGRRIAKEYLTTTSRTVDFKIHISGASDGEIINVTELTEL